MNQRIVSVFSLPCSSSFYTNNPLKCKAAIYEFKKITLHNLYFTQNDIHVKSTFKWEKLMICKLLSLFSHSVVSDSFVTPWTIANQARLSMGFSRQEYWRRFPSPGNRHDPGIEPMSPALQVDSLPLSHWESQT